MRSKLVLTLALLAPATRLLPPPEGVPKEAAEHASAGRWEEARALLREQVERSPAGPEILELYGRCLLELGRGDEAAHQLEQAALALEARGDERGGRRVRSLLARADALYARRDRLWRDMTSQLFAAARQLDENGHAERALDLLTRIARIAAGRDAEAVRELEAKVRSGFERVDLDRAGSAGAAAGARSTVRLESACYLLECDLEPELVQLVADTMDAIHAYYVEVYFDGDAKRASGPKATIRIHADRESMLRDWQGGTPPEGWWSPGENRVVCYDTRGSTGTLDWMLTTLFHEASHQFMTLLSARGGYAPTWLNEGTSCFFEGAVAMADRRVLWPDAALPRLQHLAAMLQGGTGPQLREVVSYAGGGSYPGEYYPFGWGLVYFMQQYEDPRTLAHVYRPLYASYREQATSKGADSMELFQRTFLGPSSPLGHREFADFERDWRAWILDTVRPLHLAPPAERRALRHARIQAYLAAADAAARERRAAVSERELLLRALGDLEYVRTRIDGPKDPQLATLLRQADVLERLQRPESAAPLLESVLDLADQGRFALPEGEYAAVERRLHKLDARNWALRQARSRTDALARSARRLAEDYLAARPSMTLRAYTLAATAGEVLGDAQGLAALAAELRARAREAGLLHGSMRVLASARGPWKTIYNGQPKDFVLAGGRVELESVRPIGYVDTSFEVGAEYELRARLVRHGEVHASSAHGLVLAGDPESDWYAFGILGDGEAALWRVTLVQGGGASSRMERTIALDPPLAADEQPWVALRVSERRSLQVRIDGRAPFQIELPADFPRGRHVGVYVKDGRVELSSALVELYP